MALPPRVPLTKDVDVIAWMRGEGLKADLIERVKGSLSGEVLLSAHDLDSLGKRLREVMGIAPMDAFVIASKVYPTASGPPSVQPSATSGPNSKQPEEWLAFAGVVGNAVASAVVKQMQDIQAAKEEKGLVGKLASLTKQVRRMRLHESISHSYAAVGSKAVIRAQPTADTLDCLSAVDEATGKKLWRDWLAKNLPVPELNAPETQYQPILEALIGLLLDDKQFRLCGNVYILPLRPDISVIPIEELYPRWSNLLWCAELETNLKEKYHHGLGQAWSYSGEACLRQESRNSIFVVVTSLREIQILRRSWDDDGEETATCTAIMPLLSSSDDPPPGFLALVRLARAKLIELGYTGLYLTQLKINNLAYDLLCVISNGGKAKIYKARREGKLFAIKVLEANASSRIEREAAVLKELRPLLIDAQIPRLVDVECTSHCACLVTSPAGIPLTAEMLQHGSVPLDACFGYGRQVIRILRTVHKAGFLHCDIHPGNFIVDDEKKNVFLVDWELAHRADVKQHEVQLRGVPAYLSDAYLHDMVVGKPHETTWQDDLLSLGYSLLYLSNGHLPWIGDDCAEILAKRQDFAFPDWFKDYRKRVAQMDASDASYENLAMNLLESGPKDKCTVILRHSRTPARNGTECGKGLPCPQHNANAKRWQTLTE